MFIFDAIGDMLSALGLVTAGGISVLGLIAFVLLLIIAIPSALLITWTIICVIWFWTKKAYYKIRGWEFPEYVDPPGFTWIESLFD